MSETRRRDKLRQRPAGAECYSRRTPTMALKELAVVVVALAIIVAVPRAAIPQPQYQDRFVNVNALRLHYLTMPGLGHYPDSGNPAGFLAIIDPFLKRPL